MPLMLPRVIRDTLPALMPRCYAMLMRAMPTRRADDA
jgi:hypothetical protein